MSNLLEVAENWANEVWQRGNMALAEQVCAENYVDYTVPEHVNGDCAAFQEAVLLVRTAFPDLQVEVQDSLEDGDYVALRIEFKGTHQGSYLGFEATQGELEWESIEILHFSDGQLLERFAQNDLMEMLEEGETSEEVLIQSAERTELIGRLADVPRQVREAIRRNGVQAARVTEWSTQALVGHLWRVERMVWQTRLSQMEVMDNPYWEWWEPEGFDWEADFGESSIDVLLDAYDFLRGETCRYLRDLPDEAWARVGTHATFGELDVMGLMEKAFEHDQEHLGTLTGAIV